MYTFYQTKFNQRKINTDRINITKALFFLLIIIYRQKKITIPNFIIELDETFQYFILFL